MGGCLSLSPLFQHFPSSSFIFEGVNVREYMFYSQNSAVTKYGLKGHQGRGCIESIVLESIDLVDWSVGAYVDCMCLLEQSGAFDMF
jgi:hypothetical protein